MEVFDKIFKTNFLFGMTVYLFDILKKSISFSSFVSFQKEKNNSNPEQRTHTDLDGEGDAQIEPEVTVYLHPKFGRTDVIYTDTG